MRSTSGSHAPAVGGRGGGGGESEQAVLIMKELKEFKTEVRAELDELKGMMRQLLASKAG